MENGTSTGKSDGCTSAPHSDPAGEQSQVEENESLPERDVGVTNNFTEVKKERIVIYGLDERPTLFQSLLLGFQHFLTFFSTGIAPPLLLAGPLCMDQDQLAVSQLLSTAFFVEGIVTLLQVTFGVRLPIVQGGSAAFLVPAFAILKTHGDCPVSVTANSTAEEKANYTEVWQFRIREIQGAMMVASLLQVFIGFTGIVGSFLKYMGPVTVSPVVALVGIGVLAPSANRAGQHWGMAILTIALILLFSQFLSKFEIPVLGRRGGEFKVTGRIPVFKLFPIALSILLAWFIAYILTVNDVFPDNPAIYGYRARTDLNSHVIAEASWFRVPYPGQWGLPFLTVAGVLGMFSAVVASVIESLGDYYACARMAGAPPAPTHAVNRGIALEGIGSILAGAWGTANGITSYSTNVGLVGLTKVGSIFVIQICALFMIVFGMLGKVTALLSSIPIPIVGGMLCILFGMVLAVGLSNLQYVDLNSARNLMIIGFALFMGMVIPFWVENNSDVIKTGIVELDQVIKVLLTTGMFLGGVVAFVLDNIVPGTLKERGIIAFAQEYTEERAEAEGISSTKCYDLPIGMTFIRKWKWTRYIPFCPTFIGSEPVARGGPCSVRGLCVKHKDEPV